MGWFAQEQKCARLMLAAAIYCTCSSVSAQPAGGRGAHCPAGSWSWSRWNDPYGLNVAGFLTSVPGWTYAFDRETRIIAQDAGTGIGVEVVIRARPASKRRGALMAEQHLYGYWSHADLRVKPDWVNVRCGDRAPIRVNDPPSDSFRRRQSEPPSTDPSPPLSRPGWRSGL